MKKKNPEVTVREATQDDIPALVQLNRAAYPALAEENVVSKDQRRRTAAHG